MKREIKIIIIVTCLLAVIGGSVYLYLHNMYTYLIVSATLAVLITIGLIIYVFNTRNEEARYKNNLKKILNYYDAVLVQSYNFPNLKGKNIIKVANIEDLIDAQIEIRKPVYYMIEGEDSCSFVLLDNNEACVFVLKQNEQVESPLELIMAEYEKHNDIDESLLEDIEKTTIIKLNGMKSFKVSPYKKKAHSNIEDNSDYQELDKNVEKGVTNKTDNVFNKEVKEETREFKVKPEEKQEIEEDVETI
jgi:hypothetical protein